MIVDRDQKLSDCGTYEYTYSRIWDPSKPPALWVMLHPSPITLMSGEFPAPADGPTARRCVDFSLRYGCGGTVTANLFAVRTRDSHDLATCEDPVGPENCETLRQLIDEIRVVIAAWGGTFPRQYQGHVDGVRDALRAKDAHCLGKTKSGEPRHPLYMRKDSERVPL